jgi:anti-sigma factor RsiW
MSCEKYKAALIEAAASSEKTSGDLRAHVDSCASCTAELAGQRSLIAALDANLHRQMNAPVPAAMLLRLEARLAQEPQSPPARSPKFSWLYTAATFATAAGLILFAMPRLRTHKPNLQPVALTQSTASQTAQSTADAHPQIIPMPVKPAVQLETRRIKHHSPAVAASQPEILVPPDEQIALTKFVAHLNARRELLVALATPIHQGFEPPFKRLEIPDINTAEIVIEPIATEARR